MALLSACSENNTENQTSTSETTSTQDTVKTVQGAYDAISASEEIVIDGKSDEEIWSKCEWMKMDQVWLGSQPDSTDYQGRFKACWDTNYIYLLVEIVDDSLVDTHEDPLDHYWDDDCVEIFVDEDNSDGNHQYNHNAFAYHIGLDYTVVDIGPDSIPHEYPHVIAKRIKAGNKYYWEMSMQIYSSNYVDGENNSPIQLSKGKELGFMIAYCDNDTSATRENFVGTIFIEGENKDQGWINAGVFGSMTLK